MSTIPPPPSQGRKVDPHQRHVNGATPSPSTASASPHRRADSPRVRRLCKFMLAHDIAWADVAEALSTPDASMDRGAAYVKLVHNKTLDAATRDKLLDLGFPENTLQPQRKVRSPRFPGRKARGAGPQVAPTEQAGQTGQALQASQSKQSAAQAGHTVEQPQAVVSPA